MYTTWREGESTTWREGESNDQECSKILTAIQDQENDITYLWEIHGGSPGLDILAPYIHQIRHETQIHNKTFFSFTLVRDQYHTWKAISNSFMLIVI